MNWQIANTADFTEEEYLAAYERLSPSRKAHIDTFRHPGARKVSLAAQLLLEQMLQKLQIHTVVERLPSGQPVLQNRQSFVSIAHCDDWVVCAVSSKPIGIDIEKIRPTKPGMLQKVCTPEELEYAQQEESRFFEIWTAKEAYFKMKGTGITNFQDINTLSLHRQIFRKDNYIIQIVTEE